MIIPKENQSLEEPEQLLLAEIEKVKNGDFPDWLIPAIINDMKLQKIRNLETADGLATALYGILSMTELGKKNFRKLKFEKITKQDVVDFAQNSSKNYVIVKNCVAKTKILSSRKSGITPVKINEKHNLSF